MTAETASTPTKPTADSVFMSLNGFDEIAIAAHFGSRIEQLRPRQLEDGTTVGEAFTFMRALVFIDRRRQGHRDADAHTFAMELTMDQLTNGYFEESPKAPVGKARARKR